MDNKKKLIAGITATGKLTLGNYIGSIKPLVDLQETNNLYVFVANLHAITLPIDKKELIENTFDIFAMYIACGINPSQSKIFIQSEIRQHLEMFYYLLINTSMGELSRMTQFKDKSSKVTQANGTEMIPTGLFTYPILMAGDILLYNADGVVVGQDQKQHLELTQILAKRMNSKYGLNFTIPQPFINKVGNRIMSLKDPMKKMSKSDIDLNSSIFLTDTSEEIKSKISKAVTDSENKVYYDVVNKPGVSNLITICASLLNKSIEEVEESFKELNYKEFKEKVTEIIAEALSKVNIKFNELKNNDYSELKKIISQNKDELTKEASEVITNIEKSIGIKY